MASHPSPESTTNHRQPYIRPRHENPGFFSGVGLPPAEGLAAEARHVYHGLSSEKAGDNVEPQPFCTIPIPDSNDPDLYKIPASSLYPIAAQTLATYNWDAFGGLGPNPSSEKSAPTSAHPTILVPGYPACWTPPDFLREMSSNAIQLPKDSGFTFIDQNRFYSPNGSPMEACFRALKVCAPDFQLEADEDKAGVEFVTDRNNLLKLYRICSNANPSGNFYPGSQGGWRQDFYGRGQYRGQRYRARASNRGTSTGAVNSNTSQSIQPGGQEGGRGVFPGRGLHRGQGNRARASNRGTFTNAVNSHHGGQSEPGSPTANNFTDALLARITNLTIATNQSTAKSKLQRIDLDLLFPQKLLETQPGTLIMTRWDPRCADFTSINNFREGGQERDFRPASRDSARDGSPKQTRGDRNGPGSMREGAPTGYGFNYLYNFTTYSGDHIFNERASEPGMVLSSQSHHRIIKYSWGGHGFMVRFHSDTCLHTPEAFKEWVRMVNVEKAGSGDPLGKMEEGKGTPDANERTCRSPSEAALGSRNEAVLGDEPLPATSRSHSPCASNPSFGTEQEGPAAQSPPPASPSLVNPTLSKTYPGGLRLILTPAPVYPENLTASMKTGTKSFNQYHAISQAFFSQTENLFVGHHNGTGRFHWVEKIKFKSARANDTTQGTGEGTSQADQGTATGSWVENNDLNLRRMIVLLERLKSRVREMYAEECINARDKGVGWHGRASVVFDVANPNLGLRVFRRMKGEDELPSDLMEGWGIPVEV